MSDRPDRLYRGSLLLLVVLLATPLYFVTTPGGMAFAPLLAFEPGITVPGFGIPIALAGVLLLGGAWLLQVIRKRTRCSDHRLSITLTLVLISWMTAVGVHGVYSADRPVLAGALCAQTVLPLVVFLAVLTVPLSDRDTKRTLLAIPVVGSGSLLLLLLVGGYLFASHPPSVAFALLAEAFYSAKNVHPVVVAAGIAVLLWQVSRAKEDRDVDGWKLWCMLSIHGAYLLIIWSRSGLLMIGATFLGWILREVAVGLRARIRRARFWAERGAATTLFLLFGALSVTSTGVAFRPGAASLEELTASEADDALGYELGAGEVDPVAQQRFGDARRMRLVLGGLARISSSPVVGMAFQPLPPGSVVFGRPERAHKLYPSHNQFVDIGVRAGVPALVLYVSLLATVAITLWQRANAWGRGTFRGELAMAVLFLMGATVLACLFQNYLVVTQPAVLIFVVVGIASTGSGRTSERTPRKPG